MSSGIELHILDRGGPEEYSETLSVQTNLLEAKIADRDIADVLIFAEHEEIYTVGRSVKFQKIEVNKLPKQPRWVEISRGGKATFHGPGQLLAYPIFDLKRHGSDVHLYLRMLELAVIKCLAKFDIHSQRLEGRTGVWVSHQAGDKANDGVKTEWKKIASIGVGVRKWVSYHGLALNVSTDLRFFQAISPCGESGEVMTSMAELLPAAPSMSSVKTALEQSFREVFSFLPISYNANSQALEAPKKPAGRVRPQWLRVKAPGSPEYLETLDIVRNHKLVTVCEEARCPNMGECWTHGTATFMIMGDKCTRRCSFCAVDDGTIGTLDKLDPLEPLRIAQAVNKLSLKHAVITSVNRDDLSDMGAKHFDNCVRAVSSLNPECDIELLIPDMRGKRELVEQLLASCQGKGFKS